MNSEIPLGKDVRYTTQYDPKLLFPVPRAANRIKIGIKTPLPFTGQDIWNAYEISWLNPKGKPEVAIGRIHIPVDSENIVESKSLKLYLNSFNQTRFDSAAAVEKTLAEDLGRLCGKPVKTTLTLPGQFPPCPLQEPTGALLDDMDIAADCYTPNPNFLSTGKRVMDETLYSNLLRSNCPVTGQPDWGTVVIGYRGKEIEREGLLRYIISFREHTGFHEHCVEQIFMDLSRHCRPEYLWVYAGFTRRGGIDINPFRCSCDSKMPALPFRTARQ